MNYKAIKVVLPDFWILTTGDDFHNKNLSENNWAYHRGTKSIGRVTNFVEETSTWSFNDNFLTTSRDSYKLFKIIGQSQSILPDIPSFDIPNEFTRNYHGKYDVELDLSNDGEVKIISYQKVHDLRIEILDIPIGMHHSFRNESVIDMGHTHLVDVDDFKSSALGKRVLVVGSGGMGSVINEYLKETSLRDLDLISIQKDKNDIDKLKLDFMNLVQKNYIIEANPLKEEIPIPIEPNTTVSKNNNYINGKKLPKKKKK